MLGIVDYKMGNLASVQNAFLKLGAKVKILKEPSEILACSHLVLPGVGAFKEAMLHLEQKCFKEALNEFIKSGKPLLGICLGMQLLFERSFEFGESKGLCFLKGDILPFSESLSKDFKIPHVGWNEVRRIKESPLLEGIEERFYLYFVHSFYAKNNENTIGLSEYGVQFTSIVQKDNIFGIQPHPEKSQDVGLKILENFIKI
ncbi:imidazole glycerol phosphate synthase subunit HisH [Helicobacter burdigaliensis]|uniref:imidazole glycerol phosphate synthase subunit HisH n=1 Tax=Helicobacter burdigaliensis TaxID=2315334 RepID=UPI000EF70F3A|nr:imidazole glycerol phosphate synthase subunit HisH [Helicobacter burdigaliensis]